MEMILPSYLHNGISYTGKMTALYWIGAHDLIPSKNNMSVHKYNLTLHSPVIFPAYDLAQTQRLPLQSWHSILCKSWAELLQTIHGFDSLNSYKHYLYLSMFP